MSAIECKIIICGGDAANVSAAPTKLITDLDARPDLAKKIIRVQEKYVHAMQPLLSELTK
jgi:hypothetical protein